MAYWVDDGFDTWPEVVRAGKAATGLYVCCGAWIARNIGNGNITEPVVPAEIATMYGTPEWVTKLVDAGLWRTEEAGYRDVHYFRMGNPDAATVQKRRADAAERQRKWRERARRPKKPPVTPEVTRDSPGSHNDSNGASHSSPALPPLKGAGAHAPAQTRDADAAPPTNPRTTTPICPTCGNRTNSHYHQNICTTAT